MCTTALSAALAVFRFLTDLARSEIESEILDIPSPAETRRDLEEVLVEGPTLLVRARLRLVGSGDGEGEDRHSSLLEKSSDL